MRFSSLYVLQNTRTSVMRGTPRGAFDASTRLFGGCNCASVCWGAARHDCCGCALWAEGLLSVLSLKLHPKISNGALVKSYQLDECTRMVYCVESWTYLLSSCDVRCGVPLLSVRCASLCVPGTALQLHAGWCGGARWSWCGGSLSGRSVARTSQASTFSTLSAKNRIRVRRKVF